MRNEITGECENIVHLKYMSQNELDRKVTTSTFETETEFESSSSNDTQGESISNSLSTGKASVPSSITTLLNTVAGAGMLGLPAAFASCGYLGGTFFLFWAGLFSANGLRLLSICAETVRKIQIQSGKSPQPATFHSVVKESMPSLSSIVDLAVALKCFGVGTGYFITVGDCMVESFHYFLGTNKKTPYSHLSTEEHVLLSRHFWIFAALISVLPISFFKTLDSLKFTNAFSLILIYSLSIGIVLYAAGVFDPCEGIDDSPPDMTDINSFEFKWDIQDDIYNPSVYNTIRKSPSNENLLDLSPSPAQCHGSTHMYPQNFEKTLSKLPIFVFSFTCHQNIFSIYNELSNPRSQSRLDKVISITMTLVLVLYLIVSIAGYKTFGHHVLGDILLNYPQTLQITIMRVFIAVMVILSYPLQLDPSRRCIISLVNTLQKKVARQHQQDEGTQTIPLSSNIDDDDHEDDLSPGERIEEESEDGCEIMSGVNEDGSGRRTNEEKERLNEIYNDFIFNAITCIFLLMSFIIAMTVADLGIILALVGATGSTTVR